MRIRIKIVSIGSLPPDFDKRKIKKWKSSVFEIVDGIENYSFSCKATGPDW